MIVKSLHGGKKLHVILRIHVYSFLEYIIIIVTLNPVNYISDESALQNGNLNINCCSVDTTDLIQIPGLNAAGTNNSIFKGMGFQPIYL